MPELKRKGFEPVAYRQEPTKLEKVVGMSIGPTALAQAEPEDVLETKKPPKAVTFVPAPTPQQIEEAEAKAPKWSYNLGARWTGMLEGLSESLGIKQALTIMAFNPMPGDMRLMGGVNPHAIAYLEKKNPKAAKKLKSIETEARNELQGIIKEGVIFKDIQDGYDHLEKDVQQRNENNHFLWNSITDLGDVVMAIPALAAELGAPKQIRAEEIEAAGSKEEAERRKGKEFGKMFGGGFIGGVGETLRHPFDTFTARPFLTAVTLLPFGRALLAAGRPALVPAGQAIIRAGTPAAEAVAGAAIRRMPSVATWAVKGAEKINAGRTIIKQYLVDGLWQGDRKTTALVEDLIMDPRKAQSRVQSLYDRAATALEKGETKLHPEKAAAALEEVQTQYHINEAGQVVPHSTQYQRIYKTKDAVTELNKQKQKLQHDIADWKSAIDDLNRQGFQRDPMRTNAEIIMDYKKTIKRAAEKLENVDRQLGELTRSPDRVKQRIRFAEDEGFVLAEEGTVPHRIWRTENKALESMVDKIWETSKKLFPEEWGMTRQKLGATLFGVLNRDSILLFRDKAARGALADWVLQTTDLKYFNKRKVKKQLEKIFEEHAKKLDPTLEEFPTITIGEGINKIELFSKEMLPEAMAHLEGHVSRTGGKVPLFFQGRMTTKSLAADTLRAVGNELTSNMFVDGIKSGVKSEKAKWLPAGEEVNMPAYAQNIAKKTLVENLLDPQVIAAEPAELAAMLRANAVKIADDVLVGQAEAAPITGAAPSGPLAGAEWVRRQAPVAAWKLQRLADRIEGYVALPAELGGGYAPPALARSLNWTMKINQHLRGSDLMGSFLRFMKGNVTAHNLPTHLNNYISNVGMIMMKRGTIADPIRFIAAPLMKWRAFKKGGKGLTKAEIEMLEAIEEIGILDTDLIDAEMGVMGQRLWDVPVIGVAKKVLDAYNKKLAEGYKYIGDGALKLEDTMHNYGRLTSMLDQLSEGQYIRHRTSPRQKITITKTAEGFVNSKTGKVLSARELARLKAEMASEPSLGWLMDYADKPIALMALQTAPILGIASPFFTWAFKALDLPGKKGLVSRALEGGFMVETNNPGIHAAQIADAVRIGLVRSIAINGMRDQLENFKEIGKLWKYLPTQASQQIVAAMTNPLYAMGMNFTNASWAGPTEMLFRAGTAAWKEMTYDDKELEYLYPEGKDLDRMEGVSKEELRNIKKRRQLYAKYEMGEVWSASNSLDLIGLAGSPLLDMVQYIAQSEEARKDFKWTDIYKRFGTLITGGTLHRTLDIGIAAADQLNSLSTREWAVKPDSAETEEFIGWAIRRSLGYGWTYKNIAKKKKKWFTDRKTAWNASLVTPLKWKLKDMKSEWSRLDSRRALQHKQGDIEAYNATLTQMSDLDFQIETMSKRKMNYSRIVNFEIAKAKEKFVRAQTKLGEGK